MNGNVSEYCSDRYDENYYKYSPQIDPIGPDNGKMRVKRGGDWFGDAKYCSLTFRSYEYPTDVDTDNGLRLVLDE